MSVAICLLVYGFAVSVLAPRLLGRIGYQGATPKFALVSWLTAMASTVLAWITAVVVLLIDLATHRLSTTPQRYLDTCITHFHDAAVGRYGAPAQAGLMLLSGLTTVAAVVLVFRLGRSLVRARSTTHEHARLARLAGRHHHELDAVVLDVDEPAAYCVAGKTHTVVLSRSVLAALDGRHLEAVLAHERAHLAGRHHLLLALTRGLAAVLPRITLFTFGAREVAMLLEMVADDAAARIHGRRNVIEALVALGGMATGPVGTLGATQVGLIARIERLSAPAATVARTRAQAALAAAATLVPLTSVAAAAAGIALCASVSA
ncbi:M56 family metallopeptidase [Nocardia huaxiensis]|uniref:M56 family metallopeptidase n=1 Tax=Nocardia huaxiensis TaxID=2755382 RepID=A0A7D6V6V7_9NOCA|nr:M56 family metallopeptidase [Nocardia huaxiensis]QLY29001.1 M56 family metallopeptidase [Nocardia huaxiensis]UFS97517.1 M56 family metallopeptidase [Nocardia huaxiensis]